MFIHRDLNPKTNKQNKQNSFKRKETKLPKHSQAPTSNTLNRGIRLQAQASDSKGVKPFQTTTTGEKLKPGPGYVRCDFGMSLSGGQGGEDIRVYIKRKHA
jgi:hypothetical protein